MTTTRNNRFRLNTLVAGAVVALLAGSAIAQTGSQQPTPKPMPFEDPITSLPFDFLLDPLSFDDPTDKDDTPPIPISYVDIPEIDRAPDSDGDGDNPLGSVAQPDPITPIGGTGGLFNPIDVFPDPFRPNAGGIQAVPVYPDFRNGGGIFFPDVIVNGVNIYLDGIDPGAVTFSSIPTPGTLFVGGLALGAVARRRRR